MTILITGATGFIGKALTEYLYSKHEYNIRVCVREKTKCFPSSVDVVVGGDLSKNTLQNDVFSDVDCIIHLAGQAHNISRCSDDTLEQFRNINVKGTLNLANQAAKNGVKRFVFLSSIGVNGNSNLVPFTEHDMPVPVQEYAISKYEAEQSLKELSSTTGLEVIIIRPPLVYGAKAPGNFHSLLKIIYRGFPLPLGMVKNKRSILSLNNLVDFITLCIHHPNAANQTFLVADGNDLSTPTLIRILSHSMEKSPKLIYIPVIILKIGAVLAGKKKLCTQLCGNLQVDIDKSKQTLNWTPPYNTYEELRKSGVQFIGEMEK